VGIVEPDQPGAGRRAQGERVREAVGSLLGCLDAPDLELEPLAYLEVMDAPIEREQELEPILGFPVLSYHLII
jgi:hypothetical protein